MFMKPKVAKCFKSDLRESRFEMARKMVGKYKPGESPFKYLTEDQAHQVKYYYITYYPLTPEESAIVNSKLEKKSKSEKVPVNVTYKDEDGTHTVSFNDIKEANDWIEFQKQQARCGGKFELV